jgi:hypothetical protein
MVVIISFSHQSDVQVLHGNQITVVDKHAELSEEPAKMDAEKCKEEYVSGSR